MSAAVAAILGGMPEPRDLRMRQEAGRCVITAGSVVLFEYDAGDILMRNMVLVALRRLGFPGQVVAQLLGLSASYVSTLFAAAKREGSAALAGQQRRGAPGTVSEQQWELARAWRAAGASDAEIGRRLGVAHTTISRALGPRGRASAGRAEPLFTGPGPGTVPDEAVPDELPEAVPDEAVPGTGEGVIASRYAGAMLLHAFLARADAGAVLGGAGRPRRDAALLTAVSVCFALGAATVEQFKHLAAGDAGPLAGLGVLPALRTLRPKLAAIADGTTRSRCRPRSPPRCWPRTRWPPGSITSMTTSSPTPARNRSRKGGITSAGGRREAGRTLT